MENQRFQLQDSQNDENNNTTNSNANHNRTASYEYKQTHGIPQHHVFVGDTYCEIRSKSNSNEENLHDQLADLEITKRGFYYIGSSQYSCNKAKQEFEKNGQEYCTISNYEDGNLGESSVVQQSNAQYFANSKCGEHERTTTGTNRKGEESDPHYQQQEKPKIPPIDAYLPSIREDLHFASNNAPTTGLNPGTSLEENNNKNSVAFDLENGEEEKEGLLVDELLGGSTSDEKKESDSDSIVCIVEHMQKRMEKNMYRVALVFGIPLFLTILYVLCSAKEPLASGNVNSNKISPRPTTPNVLIDDSADENGVISTTISTDTASSLSSNDADKKKTCCCRSLSTGQLFGLGFSIAFLFTSGLATLVWYLIGGECGCCCSNFNNNNNDNTIEHIGAVRPVDSASVSSTATGNNLNTPVNKPPEQAKPTGNVAILNLTRFFFLIIRLKNAIFEWIRKV